MVCYSLARENMAFIQYHGFSPGRRLKNLKDISHGTDDPLVSTNSTKSSLGSRKSFDCDDFLLPVQHIVHV